MCGVMCGNVCVMVGEGVVFYFGDEFAQFVVLDDVQLVVFDVDVLCVGAEGVDEYYLFGVLVDIDEIVCVRQVRVEFRYVEVVCCIGLGQVEEGDIQVIVIVEVELVGSIS